MMRKPKRKNKNRHSNCVVCDGQRKSRHFNRRLFLKAGGLSLIALGSGGTPSFLGRLVAQANAAGITDRRKTLVTIFQRGAMDGLMAVPPLYDDGLRELRPRLAMSMRGDRVARPLDLGDGYGLHPALAPMAPFYSDGRLAIVHGVGSPNKTRSHFDAQDFMETGTPFRKGTESGWLNRALQQTESNPTPFRAVSLTSSLPRSLYGPEPSLAIADLTQFKLGGGRGRKIVTPPSGGFESLYEATTVELLRGTGQESFDAIETLADLDVSGYQPAAGAEYPQSPLGRSLRQIAFLIKSQVGLEVAFAESGGWDTHVQQGTIQGAFANRARDLAQSIAAFWTDIGNFADDVVLMTMTEFGRTVHENGSGGTDHGRASCFFVLGRSVDGGKVHGSLPTIRRDDLEDGRDLPVTTDFRSVFAAVGGGHFGIRDDGALFPGWDGKRAPLLRA